MSDDRKELLVSHRESSVDPNTVRGKAQNAAALAVCSYVCERVCFYSALAGWHLYSVNNSSVRPALIRVSHRRPQTLTLLISPYLLYVFLSLSLSLSPSAASNHPRGKCVMHVPPGRHQYSYCAGVCREFHSAGQENHRRPRWANSVTVLLCKHTQNMSHNSLLYNDYLRITWLWPS